MTAVDTMAKKKPETPKRDETPTPRKPRGRPKRGGRIGFRYAIVASPEYQVWMNEYRLFLGKADVSDVYRECVRAHAVANGFRVPPAL